MAKICKAFLMDDPKEAAAHIEDNWELVENYGDRAHGNWLHTWDDGGRLLGRCKVCGAYILRQRSEFHGMEDDDYYTDWFPVAGPEEAEELNRTMDGGDIEHDFPRRYLMRTNSLYSWSRHPKEAEGGA